MQNAIRHATVHLAVTDLFIYSSLRGAHQAVASQQPELEQSFFTEGNTTKRTRFERVLYFLIRTTVQNAFGKITNAFARTLDRAITLSQKMICAVLDVRLHRSYTVL